MYSFSTRLLQENQQSLFQPSLDHHPRERDNKSMLHLLPDEALQEVLASYVEGAVVLSGGSHIAARQLSCVSRRIQDMLLPLLSCSLPMAIFSHTSSCVSRDKPCTACHILVCRQCLRGTACSECPDCTSCLRLCEVCCAVKRSCQYLPRNCRNCSRNICSSCTATCCINVLVGAEGACVNCICAGSSMCTSCTRTVSINCSICNVSICSSPTIAWPDQWATPYSLMVDCMDCYRNICIRCWESNGNSCLHCELEDYDVRMHGESEYQAYLARM